jgi:hypothetical protein
MANYRKIWEEANGPIPLDELGRTYEIHHIDGNRKNNELSNLQCVSIEEHYKIHKNQKDYNAAFQISLRMNMTAEERLESIKNMSECRKGKDPWNKGKTGIYTQETKDRIAIATSKSSKGRIPWNKGLDKETDERVKKSSEKISESLKGLLVGEKNPMKNAKNAKKVGDAIKGRVPWNKGLKKETDERVNQYSKKLSEINTKK